MITISGLTKKYGSLTAVNQVSVKFQKGRVTGILGPNGSGKTTLIKSLLGLVVPNSGDISIEGTSVLNSWSYRNKIGYLPQNPDFPGNLTVRELFDMIEDLRNRKACRRQELELLFDLTPHLNRPFGVLSGGTKQKVGAISALMFEPEILVLDEPSVGLDPIASTKLKRLIIDAAKGGASVLLVTHILSEAQAMVDDVVFMLDGQIHFSGPLTDMLAISKSKNLDDAVVALSLPLSPGIRV